MKTKAKKVGTFNEEYRDEYKVDKSVRTVSGAYSVSNQDDTAKALNGLTVEQLEKVAAKAGLSDRWKKWSGLNPGMQRMNLGNVLRSAVNGEGGAKVKAALAEARKMPRAEKPVTKKPAKKAKATRKAARVAPAASEAVATT